MVRSPIAHAPIMNVTIARVPDVVKQIRRFEWKSFTNAGYIIKARIDDPYWNILRDMATGYLKEGRKNPEKSSVEWTLAWPNDNITKKRKALISHLNAKGIQGTGYLEFVAIDPPSFALNAGNVDGSVYTGNVGEVIQQVVQRYAPGIQLEVSDTADFNKNKWWMMRQDPKTFIMSLLEWSSSITPNKTNWIVASRDDKLIIKEQAELESTDFGIYSVNVTSPGLDDVREFEFLGNSFLTTYNTQLLTHGISAVSERYLDKVTDADQNLIHVNDRNTTNKRNTEIKQDRGFKKPEDSLNFDGGSSSSGGTAIMAIPEFNAGDLGITYDNWIDGRARTRFLDMLKLVMRLRIRINGDPQFDDSTQLGISTLTLQWFDVDNNSFFLSGKWLVYGWHHVVTNQDWYTDLYLSRLDFDATAKTV